MNKLEDVKEYISKHGLDSKDSSYEVLYPRQYLCAYIKHTFGRSLKDIRDIFNYVSHASVIGSINKHYDLMSIRDNKYAEYTSAVSDLFPFKDSVLDVDRSYVYRVTLGYHDKIILGSLVGMGTGIENIINEIVRDKINELKQ